MWPWIKRWLDCAMRNLWPLTRSAQPQGLHYSCTSRGLTLDDQPIPWSADSACVEALVRLPHSAPRRKADFLLRLPGCEPVVAEQMTRVEGPDHYRVRFDFTPPGKTVAAEVLYRGRALGQLVLPYLSREDFLSRLHVEMPTLSIRLGAETVACETFLSAQCRGVVATALLSSPTSLVPLLDVDLQVEFRCERTGNTFRVPARLSSTQLSGRTALVTVVPPRYPRRLGTWTARWLVGEQVLAQKRIRGISQRAFQRSLRICDTRFIVQEPGGACRPAVQAPPSESGARVGPCFLVASSEPGMAGMCKVQVSACVPGAVRPPLLLEQEVLISDGPSVIAPGTLDAADLAGVSGFELSAGGVSLGQLSLRPVPVAEFTGEGGFKAPEEYSWSASAEEEMNERLSRLLDGQARGE